MFDRNRLSGPCFSLPVIGHAPSRALATLIALVAVLSAVAPTVDALAFGVHEHIATTRDTSGAQGIASRLLSVFDTPFAPLPPPRA